MRSTTSLSLKHNDIVYTYTHQKPKKNITNGWYNNGLKLSMLLIALYGFLTSKYIKYRSKMTYPGVRVHVYIDVTPL